MDTNSNTTEAKQPASAGCHPTTCSVSWMPIDTAPTNGVRVIGWSKRHGAHIGPVANYKKREMPLGRGGWFQPSHWMHIPIPPNV